MPHKVSAALLLLTFVIAGCRPVQERPLADVPLVPVSFVTQGGFPAIWWRAPVRVQDERMPVVEYDVNGNVSWRTVNESMFPTDVLIVYTEETNTARVFLRRSPHGGCLLLLREDPVRFEDPCYGSRFDLEGNYLDGPSPRHLDQLPATLRGNMIWMTPQIVYGGPSRPGE